jgi:hypothetical protein
MKKETIEMPVVTYDALKKTLVALETENAMLKKVQTYKLVVPRQYVDMFKNNVDLTLADVKVGDRMVHLTREVLNDNYRIFETKYFFYPESWYLDINDILIEDIIDGFNHSDNAEKYLCVKTKSKEFFFLHWLKDSILEIDETMCNARPDLNARLQHIEKHWAGITCYEFIEESDEGEVTESARRYFIWKTDWLHTDGSTGGGNITSVMTLKELEARLNTDETYHEAGPHTFRLRKSFIEGRKNV